MFFWTYPRRSEKRLAIGGVRFAALLACNQNYTCFIVLLSQRFQSALVKTTHVVVKHVRLVARWRLGISHEINANRKDKLKANVLGPVFVPKRMYMFMNSHITEFLQCLVFSSNSAKSRSWPVGIYVFGVQNSKSVAKNMIFIFS